MGNKQKAKKFNKLKIIALYELTASFLVILSTIYTSLVVTKFIFLPLNFFLAMFGIFGGLLLFKNKKNGLYLSFTWAFLQIFIINVGEKTLINLNQFFYFTLTFIKVIKLQNYPDIIFLPNIIGILILILLIVFRKDLYKK